MRTSESLKELATALGNFQQEVHNPANNARNPQFNSKYAPLDTVINTVKPVLAKHGLSFIQSTGTSGEDSITVKTLLLHKSGEWIESDPLTLPAYQTKKGGAKEFNAQGAGSSITYARRYSLSAILGISSEDDDDGNYGSGYKSSSATPNKPVNDNGTDEEKERKRQEAIKNAQQKANKNKPVQTEPTTKPSENATEETKTENNSSQNQDTVVEGSGSITAAQETVINNLFGIIKRKDESFDAEEFTKSELNGKEIKDLTETEAKQFITRCTQVMRGK